MNSAVGRVFKESFVEKKMFVGSLRDPLESLKSLLKRPSQKKRKKKAKMQTLVRNQLYPNEHLIRVLV